MNFSKAKAGDLFCMSGLGYNETFFVLHVDYEDGYILLLCHDKYNSCIITNRYVNLDHDDLQLIATLK